MTAFLAAALLLGELPFTIEVTAVEAVTGRPLAGVVILLYHEDKCSYPQDRPITCELTHEHPPELYAFRGTTGNDGRFQVRVPDLDYQTNSTRLDQGNAAYLDQWHSNNYAVEAGPRVVRCGEDRAVLSRRRAHLLPEEDTGDRARVDGADPRVALDASARVVRAGEGAAAARDHGRPLTSCAPGLDPRATVARRSSRPPPG
jgi:hypothetical protein